MSAAFETARDFAGRGFGVFPVHSVVDGRCTCGDPTCREAGKHPRTRNGFKDATTDERVLLDWDRRWPTANWGAPCERFSVLDIDSKHGADPAELVDEHDLDGRPAVWTGEALKGPLAGVRGAHIYVAGGARTGPSPVAGVEVRGHGAYVLLPGSRHVSGVAYAWADELRPWTVELRPLPVGLQPRARSAPAASVGETIPEGQRNTTLCSLAGMMRRRGLSERAIRAALEVVNDERCRPPLSASEVAGIAASVARYAPAPHGDGGGSKLGLGDQRSPNPRSIPDSGLSSPLCSADPLGRVPASEYLPWLASAGCPGCGGELVASGTAWFCPRCPPRPHAGRERLGGGIYTLAALLGGLHLPVRGPTFLDLQELLVEGYLQRGGGES